jgi:hypothetical protein
MENPKSKPRASVRKLAMQIEADLQRLGYSDDLPSLCAPEALALQIDVYQVWLKAALASIGRGGDDAKYRQATVAHAREIALRCFMLIDAFHRA